MKIINNQQFTMLLENNVYDYSMLLPLLKNDQSITSYISKKDDQDFICIYDFDGNKMIEIHWELSDDTEIMEFIKKMKCAGHFSNLCYVTLYKSKKFSKNLKDIFKIENEQFLISYYDSSVNSLPKDLPNIFEN